VPCLFLSGKEEGGDSADLFAARSATLPRLLGDVKGRPWTIHAALEGRRRRGERTFSVLPFYIKKKVLDPLPRFGFVADLPE